MLEGSVTAGPYLGDLPLAQGQTRATDERAQRIILAEACGAIRAARDLLEPMNTEIIRHGWCRICKARVGHTSKCAYALAVACVDALGGKEKAE